MKKVLFVINTMGRAGAERCLLHLLKAWEDEEYELSLFAVMGRGELFEEVPTHVRILNEAPVSATVFDGEARKAFVKDILKGMIRKRLFFRELFPALKLFLWQLGKHKVDMKKLCWKTVSDTAPQIEEEFDLAVGYLQGAATYYVMDHVKAGKKIVFFHSDYEASGGCPLVDRPYYERADRIYCVSDYITEKMKKTFPSCKHKIETFYNFVDADWVREKAAEGTAPEMVKKEGTICLLTAARLEPVKAFEVAIEAMTLMKQNGIRAKWYVLGEGTLRSQLEREIREKNVEDCFFLLGAKENPYPYIAACDIYVQETRFEGFCTSITEAVILGKKIVASDCRGNSEQLACYGTGVLTQLNPQAIMEGILKAWNSHLPQADVMCRQKQELERFKNEVR